MRAGQTHSELARRFAAHCRNAGTYAGKVKSLRATRASAGITVKCRTKESTKRNTRNGSPRSSVPLERFAARETSAATNRNAAARRNRVETPWTDSEFIRFRRYATHWKRVMVDMRAAEARIVRAVTEKPIQTTMRSKALF